MRIKVNSFVIITKNIADITINSVGLIKAINGKYAMVYCIGKNQIIRLNFSSIQELDVEKTGKKFPFKICNICHVLKETNEFDINQTDAKGIKTTRPSCKDCRKKIDGAQLLLEEKKKMDELKPPLKSVFVCPICEKRSIVGITANLVRDHDHETGKAREWICDSCNTGLGRFKDNIDFIKKVVKYLKKYSR
ncbi:MAG: Hpy99I family type II restriction endonuclease [Alphaproteobacteria bacterium]|nr:Hpy99I family type II restriction endonuclease [Alphaproteobacteria bacterium]